MTILVNKRTGWGNDYMLIKAVGIRDAIFEAEGTIRFFEESFTDVVDVEIDGPNVRLYVYPHNSGDFVLKYNAQEAQIREIIRNLLVNNTDTFRKIFTLNLAKMEALTPQHFSGYAPDYDKDSLFIYDTPAKEGGFPYIYSIPKAPVGNYSRVFKVQSHSSRVVAKLTGPATELGKEFVYKILNSWPKREFDNYCPDLRGISLPTSTLEELPKFLNTENLRKFAETCGADKLVQSLDGIVDVSDKETEDKKEEKKGGADYTKELPNQIIREIVSKGTANLTDIVLVGVHAALKMIPQTFDIVPLQVESHYGIRKACIYEGKMHLLPLQPDEEFDFGTMWLGEDEDFIVHVTEETYPRLPALLPGPTLDTGKEYVQ